MTAALMTATRLIGFCLFLEAMLESIKTRPALLVLAMVAAGGVVSYYTLREIIDNNKTKTTK